MFGAMPAARVFRASWIIDGSGSGPLPEGAVVVRGDRVVRVVPAASIDPEDWQTLSFDGCTILPGLINGHCHLVMPGDGTAVEEAVTPGPAQLLHRARANAGASLVAGVTTLADLGGVDAVTLELKRTFTGGTADGPSLLVAGAPLTPTGGHCWPFGGAVAGPGAIRHRVRELAGLGADLIKVMVTGGGTRNTNPLRLQYTMPELEAAADEARRVGRPALAHCLCQEAVEAAIDAGFGVIVHGNFAQPDGRLSFDRTLARKASAAGVYWNPTLAIIKVGIASMLERGAPAEEIEAGRERYRHQCQSLMELLASGVTVVAGSDEGWGAYRFGGFVKELEAMHEAGMSQLQVILAATRDAAAALGVGGEVGGLEAGKRADMLVVEGDVAGDLGALRRVRAVIRAGQLLPRPRLDGTTGGCNRVTE